MKLCEWWPELWSDRRCHPGLKHWPWTLYRARLKVWGHRRIAVLIPRAGNDNCTCGASAPGDPRHCSCSWLYQES
jgi:hypothetical protein